jgi:hypothetical protein
VTDDGWLELSTACQSFDLLKLQGGLTTELGLDALPPGEYGQIRLGLTKASIQVGGQTYPLTIPSGTQSGIKIGHHFAVEAGGLTTLALDFDAAKSIHVAGQGYVMRPVISVVGELKESTQEVRERAATREAGHSNGGNGGAAHEDAADTEAAGRDGEHGGSAGAASVRTENGVDAGADSIRGSAGHMAPEAGAAGKAAARGRGQD